MANELILYGYIEGTPHWGDKAMFRVLQRRNRNRIKTLPTRFSDVDGRENAPVITRSFFAVPKIDETFLSQIIHFGGSYRCFSDDYWASWLTTFEQILRGMYWFGVVLHVTGELPSATYEWFPTKSATAAMFDSEQPVTEWEFRGGSRKSLWEN
jgi:hypothetical protein